MSRQVIDGKVFDYSPHEGRPGDGESLPAHRSPPSPHSPGPWRWVTPEDKSWERLDDGANGCVFVVDGWHVMPSDADRRLIAKAPELLAMLKRAVEDREPWHWDARALISEIEGE